MQSFCLYEMSNPIFCEEKNQKKNQQTNKKQQKQKTKTLTEEK